MECKQHNSNISGQLLDSVRTSPAMYLCHKHEDWFPNRQRQSY